MTHALDVELQDPEFHAEIILLTDLMVAASAEDGALPLDVIDAVLLERDPGDPPAPRQPH